MRLVRVDFFRELFPIRALAARIFRLPMHQSVAHLLVPSFPPTHTHARARCLSLFPRASVIFFSLPPLLFYHRCLSRDYQFAHRAFSHSVFCTSSPLPSPRFPSDTLSSGVCIRLSFFFCISHTTFLSRRRARYTERVFTFSPRFFTLPSHLFSSWSALLLLLLRLPTVAPTSCSTYDDARYTRLHYRRQLQLEVSDCGGLPER